MKSWLKGAILGIIVGVLFGWFSIRQITFAISRLLGCSGDSCAFFVIAISPLWIVLTVISGAIIFGLICAKPSKKKAKVKSWLKGGLIGAGIYLIISLPYRIYFMEFLGGGSAVSIYYKLYIYMSQIFSLIFIFVISFVIGAGVGIIIEKIRERKNDKK